MKKNIFKIIILFLVILIVENTVILVFGNNHVYAASSLINVDDFDPSSSESESTSSTFVSRAGNIFAAIQTIGIVVAVITLIILGIKYMIGSVEERAEYKKTIIPWTVGLILVVSVTSIPSIIVSFTGSIKVDASVSDPAASSVSTTYEDNSDYSGTILKDTTGKTIKVGQTTTIPLETRGRYTITSGSEVVECTSGDNNAGDTSFTFKGKKEGTAYITFKVNNSTTVLTITVSNDGTLIDTANTSTTAKVNTEVTIYLNETCDNYEIRLNGNKITGNLSGTKLTFKPTATGTCDVLLYKGTEADSIKITIK
jgi:type IV secretory pathway VirB2 component (pilin)